MKDRIPKYFGSILVLLALNFLLFLPYYLAVYTQHDFLPFFPSHHPRGSYDLSLNSVKEYFLQMLFRRYNLDPFRLSVEMVFISCGLVLCRSFFSKGKAYFLFFATSSYLFVFLTETYRMTISMVLDRSTLWLEDMQLIKSAIQFCMETLRLPDFSFEMLLGAVFLLVFALIYRLFGYVWEGLKVSKKTALASNAFMLGSLSLFIWWFGLLRDDTNIQVLSKHLVYNYERCLVYLENNRNFPEQSEYHRKFYEKMGVKPNIFLFVIESYGMMLFNHKPLEDRMNSLNREIEKELSAVDGLEMLSHKSTSPVYGGTSWLSTASLLAGTWINNQARYELFKQVASSFPHLINYLAYHSYQRVSFQPGTVRDGKLYGFDETFIRQDMDYKGAYIGWGGVPDYTTFKKMDERIKGLKRPFLLHYMSLSTHIPWQRPPALPHAIFSGADSQGNYDDPLAEGLMSGKESMEDYFLTISYEWRLMSHFFRKHLGKDFLVIIVGDHQPLTAKQVDPSHDVPIHILSDNPSIVAGFKKAGFRSGLIPPKQAAIKHEMIYPILLESLNMQKFQQYSAAKKAK